MKFHAENGMCPSVWVGDFLYFIKEDKYAGDFQQPGWELWKRRKCEEIPLKSTKIEDATKEAETILAAKGTKPTFKIPSYYMAARISEEKSHAWCVVPQSDTGPENRYILHKTYHPQYCAIYAPTYLDCLKAATEYVNRLATENEPMQLSFEKEC